MDKILKSFTENLKNIFKENLVSVVLYGSAVTGEFVKNISDYNILIVLKEIDLQQLKQTNKLIRKWLKQSNPPPMIFTLESLKNSTDVFPIEFLDIKSFHQILYGEDIFVNLEFSTKNLRIELERELKENYLRILQHYILVSTKPNLLKQLLIKSSSTFFSLFKAVLYLLNEKPPAKKIDAAKKLFEKLNLEVEILNKIEVLRNSPKMTKNSQVFKLFEEFVKIIEIIIKKVDSVNV